MKLVDSKVWLRDGAGMIHGWDLEDLNRMIDKFNSFPWAPEADFFQWLSWEVNDGNDYQGFSVYWHSKLMKDVHPIRKG